MKLNINDNQGMTLIEIIIAVAIMGVVAMGLLTMFTTGFSSISMAGNSTAATFDAKSQVEQALNQKNTDAAATGMTITYHSGATVTAPGKILHENQTVNGVTEDIIFFQPTY